MEIMKKRLPAMAMVIVFVTAVAFVYCYNPFAPKDLDALLSLELGRMGKGKLGDVGMMYTTRAQVAKKWERYWKSMEETMLRKGASEAEVQGVLATAREHFSYRGQCKDFMYGVPVDASASGIDSSRCGLSSSAGESATKIPRPA